MALVSGRGDKHHEIGRSEEVAYRLHAARLIQVRADIECLHVTAGTDQCDEMAASGTAPHAKPLRIEAVVLGVCAQPSYGGLAVLDLRRKHRVAAETIVDARDRVAPFRGAVAQRWAGVLAAALPAAAVNPDDHGQRPVARLRDIQIELLPLVPIDDVGKVTMCLHSLRGACCGGAATGKRLGIGGASEHDGGGDHEECGNTMSVPIPGVVGEAQGPLHRLILQCPAYGSPERSKSRSSMRYA